VKFESDVLKFIDQIAEQNQRNRSFVINQIIRHYVRMEQEKQNDRVKSEPREPMALIKF
jgi:predicted transcriptional regulator